MSNIPELGLHHGRVWLFMESLGRRKWGMRIGKGWYEVDNVVANAPLHTEAGRQQPKFRLVTMSAVDVLVERRGGLLVAIIGTNLPTVI